MAEILFFSSWFWVIGYWLLVRLPFLMEDFSIGKANLTTNLQPIANNHEPKSVIRKSFLSFFNDRFGFKAERKRKYHRESHMSKAEIMVIMILFHSSGYRCFLEKVCKHMRHLFPEVVSYNRWSSESRSKIVWIMPKYRANESRVKLAWLCRVQAIVNEVNRDRGRR